MATGMLQQRSDRRAESFVRETGAGPGVWLHANASTSGQWRGLLDGLATTFRALAPDAYAFLNGPGITRAERRRARHESPMSRLLNRRRSHD